jgi:hypothetical protein
MDVEFDDDVCLADGWPLSWGNRPTFISVIAISYVYGLLGALLCLKTITTSHNFHLSSHTPPSKMGFSLLIHLTKTIFDATMILLGLTLSSHLINDLHIIFTQCNLSSSHQYHHVAAFLWSSFGLMASLIGHLTTDISELNIFTFQHHLFNVWKYWNLLTYTPTSLLDLLLIDSLFQTAISFCKLPHPMYPLNSAIRFFTFVWHLSSIAILCRRLILFPFCISPNLFAVMFGHHAIHLFFSLFQSKGITI